MASLNPDISMAVDTPIIRMPFSEERAQDASCRAIELSLTYDHASALG